MYLLICLCLSVISLLTFKELVAKKVKALHSPSFSMWLLDFTSLLYIHNVSQKHKRVNIILPGLVQHGELCWYGNQ